MYDTATTTNSQTDAENKCEEEPDAILAVVDTQAKKDHIVSSGTFTGSTGYYW